MLFAAASAARRRQVSGATELAMQITEPGASVSSRPEPSTTRLDLLVGRHHDDDDFGVLADVRRRAAVPDAVVLGAPHRVGIDVVAGDIKALARHVPGKLQAHGAQPDHAGALHWCCLVHVITPSAISIDCVAAAVAPRSTVLAHVRTVSTTP